jgi:hypothetical protein
MTIHEFKKNSVVFGHYATWEVKPREKYQLGKEITLTDPGWYYTLLAGPAGGPAWIKPAGPFKTEELAVSHADRFIYNDPDDSENMEVVPPEKWEG